MIRLRADHYFALVASLAAHLVVLGLLNLWHLPGSPTGTLTVELYRAAQSTPSPVSRQSDAGQAIEPEAPTAADEPAYGKPQQQVESPPVSSPRSQPDFSPIKVPELPSIGSLFGSGDQTNTSRSTETASTASDQPHPSWRSNYQPRLLNQIGQERYQDFQYPFSQLKEVKEVLLLIKLQSNGTLIKAQVMKTSGDSALDQAAIRSTLAANPFPPPPAGDSVFGFEYLIPIQYRPQ